MSRKAALRKDILARRDAIPPELKKEKESAIEARLLTLPEYRSAKTVFLFASFRSEVNTFGMIRQTLEAGKRVVLPRVEGDLLGLYELKRIDELVPGYMKIPEPSVLTNERKVTVNDVDLIIIPGAAFDESGNRIGYGGGFYDRLLAGLSMESINRAPSPSPSPSGGEGNNSAPPLRGGDEGEGDIRGCTHDCMRKRQVPVVAPAFEEQVIESVPAEAHDRKVNIIVTESRIVRCS